MKLYWLDSPAALANGGTPGIKTFQTPNAKANWIKT